MYEPVRMTLLWAAALIPCALSAQGPLTLTCPAVATRAGVTYSSTLTGLAGTAPYTYSIAAGSLPPGLMLTPSSGAIAGAATTGGAFSFSAQVTDSAGNMLAGQCTINVLTTPMTLSCPATSAQLTKFYSSGMVATGGVPPYVFSVTGGLVPPGIYPPGSDGSFNGTPTAPGTFTFTAQVEDATHSTAGTTSLNCSITVGEPLKAGTYNNITEFPFPAPTDNVISIAAGPDGALWFTEYLTSEIGRITTDGAIMQYKLPFGTEPGSIVAGPDGALWFTESRRNYAGRISTSGSITEFPLPAVAYTITNGPDGALWLANGNLVFRMTTSGVVTEYRTEIGNGGTVTSGPDGNLWFTDHLNTAIWRMTTSGVISEYPLPTGFADPYGIIVGPDGALWFTESSANKIGRITTSGVIAEYPVPFPAAAIEGGELQGITLGPDGALWFGQGGGEIIGRITASGVLTQYALPAGSYPAWLAAGPDGALWYADIGLSQIGRVPACGLGLTAIFANGGVTADFDLSTAFPAIWDLTAGTKVDFSKDIHKISPPRNVTVNWNPFPLQGYVVVKSDLNSDSGKLQCSEWTTVSAF